MPSFDADTVRSRSFSPFDRTVVSRSTFTRVTQSLNRRCMCVTVFYAINSTSFSVEFAVEAGLADCAPYH